MAILPQRKREPPATIRDTFEKNRLYYGYTYIRRILRLQKNAKDTNDEKIAVIASTASPYKFGRSVMTAIDSKYAAMDEFELVDELNRLSNVTVPNAVEEIRTAPVRHKTVCNVDEMESTVKHFLGI